MLASNVPFSIQLPLLSKTHELYYDYLYFRIIPPFFHCLHSLISNCKYRDLSRVPRGHVKIVAVGVVNQLNDTRPLPHRESCDKQS